MSAHFIMEFKGIVFPQKEIKLVEWHLHNYQYVLLIFLHDVKNSKQICCFLLYLQSVFFQAYDHHLNMILGDVEETVTTIEIDEETYEEVISFLNMPVS